MTALFPGERWTADQIAAGLVKVGATGWRVVNLGAIVMAESLGYVWAHGLNHEGSGTPPSSPAYLAEGHGLIGLDDYWIMRTWTRDRADHGGLLMRPYWTGAKSFSQLAKDPIWNLAMGHQVYLTNAAARGWADAYNAWTSWRNGRAVPFLTAAKAAALNAGAVL